MSFESTYKELKHTINKVIGACLLYCFESTYKELKRNVQVLSCFVGAE